MGSRVSAEHSRDRGETITGMFSLEMIGYYDATPGSQRYPREVSYFYPERGDFIAFVSNLTSRPLLHRSIRRFRAQAILPAEGLAAPEWLVPHVRRSDNAAYWDAGFPAVMVTDTSNFRNPHYHKAGDQPHTLDYARMARAVTGLTAMFEQLAQE